jgi:hypothetical protein
VHEDDGKTSIDGKSKIEEYISFEKLPTVKQKYGRIDILIDYKKEDDYIMIMEIKATDWDLIKPKNIRKNLSRHSCQLYRYIDKYMIVDKMGSVGLALIYPSAPKKEGLREEIEEMAMELYSFPVYWYDEIMSE